MKVNTHSDGKDPILFSLRSLLLGGAAVAGSLATIYAVRNRLVGEKLAEPNPPIKPSSRVEPPVYLDRPIAPVH